MFRPADERTAQLLDSNTTKLNRFEEAKRKRNAIYDALLKHPEIGEEKGWSLVLAKAAGYTMNLAMDADEYRRGCQFVDSMFRNGYLTKTERPGEGVTIYITNKEPVDSGLLGEIKTTEVKHEQPREDILDNTDKSSNSECALYSIEFTLSKADGSWAEFNLKDLSLDDIVTKVKAAGELL